VEGSYRWVGEFTVLIAAMNCSYEQTGPAGHARAVNPLPICIRPRVLIQGKRT
jgi:hypothetical protein